MATHRNRKVPRNFSLVPIYSTDLDSRHGAQTRQIGFVYGMLARNARPMIA